MSDFSGHDIGQLKKFGTDLILAAGREALQFFGKGQRKSKFDQELVTRTELHLSEFFRERIFGVFPEHQVFEDTPVEAAYTHGAKRYLWIYDPIDGVDNFQSGIPIWGMSLSLLENFWPVFGIVYMPATGDLFHAQAGEGAYWGDKPIHIPSNTVVDDESLLLTFSRFHQHYQCNFPGKIRDLGCTTAHICYVAMGRADAAINAHESYQDLAATRIILEAAGGKFYKADGAEFHLNEYLNGERIDEHLLAVSPDNLKQVLNYLERNRHVRSS